MSATTPPDLEHNKRVTLEFLDVHMNQANPEDAAERYMGRDYTQHDALAKDGREGFVEFTNFAATTWPEMHQEVKRIVAEGDLVMAHSLITLSSKDRGVAVVDIFRFEDGKIVEHWDVRQPVPERTVSGNPFV
jgi:predicted SnoaL-like aldol condensation-catalyzing enzyme